MYRRLIACFAFAACGFAADTVEIVSNGESITLPIPRGMYLADPESAWVKEFTAKRKTVLEKLPDLSPEMRQAKLLATLHGHADGTERYIFVSELPLLPGGKHQSAAFFAREFPNKESGLYRFGDRHRVYWLDDKTTLYAVLQCRGRILRLNYSQPDDDQRATPYAPDAERLRQLAEDTVALNPASTHASRSVFWILLAVLLSFAAGTGYFFWRRIRAAAGPGQPPPLPPHGHP